MRFYDRLSQTNFDEGLFVKTLANSKLLILPTGFYFLLYGLNLNTICQLSSSIKMVSHDHGIGVPQ